MFEINSPKYVEFHLTDLCNSHCYFCNQVSLRTGNKSIDYQLFKRTLNNLKKQGLLAIRLSGGGEPTVYPKILEVVKYVQQLNISLLRFDTNGINLSPELCKKLLDCDLNILHISLQAPSSQLWGDITQRDSKDFLRILGNIECFLKLDIYRLTKVYASFVVDEKTYECIPSMSKLCNDLGIGINVHYLNCHQYTGDFKNAVIPKVNKILSNLQLRPDREIPNFCGAPWMALLIKANGDVYPCCALQDKLFIMGNILSSDIVDIWNGQKYQNFRLKFMGFNDNESMLITNPNFCDKKCPVNEGIMSVPIDHYFIKGS